MVLPIHRAQFDQIVGSVPELSRSERLSTSVLSGGLTNTSYLVNTDVSQVVVRISCDNGQMLGIDRATEANVLRQATDAGIAPEILLITQPEGHLVSRFLAQASTPTVEEFTAPTMIPRVAEMLRQVHSLEPVDGRFDPYDDIDRWMSLIKSRGAIVPTRLARLMETVDRTRYERARGSGTVPVLCHNDPYHLNFLDDGNLWLIDWEYAGMGDAMYDLAGIAYMLDRDGRDLLLQSYFGFVEPAMHADLDALIPVFVCWNAVWCLVEMDAGVEGFDYLGLAEEFLDWLPVAD